ncbi:flagellar basal-body MS-ring/collar protein FliF [Aromatoleum sp.]|uniref:flagellar basal-body MS-ring/collar protein FliF n=1 Tax=Aromatoleum sp. TaxID=2307007 RepID=UPI002FCC21E7
MIATLRPVLARLRSTRAAALPTDLLRNVVPIVVLAAAVTALVLMLLWRDQAAYKPVFGAAEKVAAAELMGVLDAEGVPYRLHPDSGQLLVPEDLLGRVRMLLAAKGVVAQLPAGLELMDRSDPLGVSQFVQDVRFRRGLEGELAQSIATLDAVASARVHLSIAKSSSFVVSDGSKSSASVVVTLKPGRALGAEQIAAIIKMVAGAVASLDPQRVSLVDQAGNLLSAQVDLTEGFDPVRGGEAERRYRDETQANVRALLAPVLGEHNYKVSVAVEVDNDRTQETHERYGETPKVTSEAMREESGRDPLAIGVPGSLSNRPVNIAEQADGKETVAAQRAATTRQYAYDRSVTQVQRGRGRLTKLSVAVIVNSAAAPGGSGQWTPDALAGIERVLAGGLGINAARGDSLVLSVLKFPDAPAPLPWWEERDSVVDAGGYAASAVGLLLAYLLVVRPLLRIAQRRWAPVLPERDITDFEPVVAIAESKPAGALGGPASGGAAGNSVVPLLENYDLPPPGSPVDVLVDHLRVLAAKEPERVAEVVKQWVQGNGRS